MTKERAAMLALLKQRQLHLKPKPQGESDK